MAALPPVPVSDDSSTTPLDRALEWRVRPAVPADCGAAALVAQATFLETYATLLPAADLVDFCAGEHSAAAYRAFLAEGARLWLAEEARTGAPLGYALLTEPDLGAASGEFAAAPDDIELKRIYALSCGQGLGLGSALLAAVVDAARALGRTRLVLGVYRGNARALAFYERSGFVPVGTRRFIVADAAYDDFILARPLGG